MGEPVGNAECSTVRRGERMEGEPDVLALDKVLLPLDDTSDDKVLEKEEPVSALVKTEVRVEAAAAALLMPTCCVSNVTV